MYLRKSQNLANTLHTVLKIVITTQKFGKLNGPHTFKEVDRHILNVCGWVRPDEVGKHRVG